MDTTGATPSDYGVGIASPLRIQSTAKAANANDGVMLAGGRTALAEKPLKRAIRHTPAVRADHLHLDHQCLPRPILCNEIERVMSTEGGNGGPFLAVTPAARATKSAAIVVGGVTVRCTRTLALERVGVDVNARPPLGAARGSGHDEPSLEVSLVDDARRHGSSLQGARKSRSESPHRGCLSG